MEDGIEEVENETQIFDGRGEEVKENERQGDDETVGMVGMVNGNRPFSCDRLSLEEGHDGQGFYSVCREDPSLLDEEQVVVASYLFVSCLPLVPFFFGPLHVS